MAIQFHDLKVSKLIRRTKDAVSVYFEITDELKDQFKYKPGQYITIKLDVQGINQRRAYSLSTSPIADTDFGVTVKEVRGGKVSPWLNNVLKVGQVLQVMPPLGNFTTEINQNNSKNYVFFAGGSGITPILSLIKSILLVEKESTCTLIYANRDFESIIFKDELEELASNNKNLKIIHILDEADSNFVCEVGLLKADKCREILKNNLDSFEIQNSEYFLCGPGGLMSQIEIALDELQVEKKYIHKESFTVDIEETTKTSDSSSTNETKKIKVHIYGEEHEIEVKPDETILAAGIRQSLDPPFSCQIGACATCQAKVLKGEVEMEADDALMEEDKIDGYVLTCTAHPVSDGVEIDYDY